ncbi:MAG: hypothetical protein PUK70_00145, partial [Bacteroidales bacterium]|nr:hypothetical protein [Bacteroidales bacterium]
SLPSAARHSRGFQLLLDMRNTEAEQVFAFVRPIVVREDFPARSHRFPVRMAKLATSAIK